ncbi:MAG: hypothetical protein HDS07_06780 [Bacteroides sp.]|nr:hypothetical protein [Bacteroides sp.]
MKKTNSRSIKSVTLTMDEIAKMLNVTVETGDTREAYAIVREKINEKTERLARQREQRRLRAEQKKAESKNSECSECSENSSKSLTISLNRAIATCILWINNRRSHLKNNILAFLHEIARYSSHPVLKSIEQSITALLNITEQAATTAHQHLHAPHRLRPNSAIIKL